LKRHAFLVQQSLLEALEDEIKFDDIMARKDKKTLFKKTYCSIGVEASLVKKKLDKS